MEEPADLVRRLAESNDSEAERELRQQFAPRVRLYGLRHLPDSAATETLVEEVLHAVQRAAREGRIQPGQLHRFVLEAARSLVPQQKSCALTSTAQPYIDAVRLATCFGMAGARDQRVLTLTFQENRSAQEIATELGLTVDDVRRIRRRVISAVRRCVEGATT